MIMWTRGQLKEKAKLDLKRSYWGLVLMSFIAGIVSGGGGGGSSSGGTSSEEVKKVTESMGNGSAIDWKRKPVMRAWLFMRSVMAVTAMS